MTLTMALPRWVMSPHVDSQAMFAAMLHFKGEHPRNWQEMQLQGMLPMVIHASKLGDRASLTDVMEVPCPETLRCPRCMRGQGGYMFRWFSTLWSEKYVELSRPGAWKPGEEEGIAPPHATGHIVDCMGQIKDLCDTRVRQ